MNHVFGPVPSRRLGQSLGIDTIPLKTCNWNCVYCQLGRSMPLTNERREYFPAVDILAEAEQVLKSHKDGEIDWVTFVGSGEPTLHSRLGELIRSVKTLTTLPVAVITNGSLLYLPEVREELSAADAVLPTLDTGTAELYRKINRPHPQITFERLVDGLIAFRKEYRGKLWVEVMLVRRLNDTTQALEDIAKILQRVKPDAVHINLPTRPPVETWVQPTDEEGLMRAISILGDIAEAVHPAEGGFDLSGYENVVDALISIITRHPMRQDELERALNRWSPRQVRLSLKDLESSGRAQIVNRNDVNFWSASSSYFPDDEQSTQTIPGIHRKFPKDDSLKSDPKKQRCIMSQEKIFEIQAEFCRAMGHPLRMEIMHLLRAGPMNVNDIASATHTNQPTISRNLATLRNVGIVVVHRNGTNAIYQVANPKIMNVCDMMREVLSEQIGERSKLMEKKKEINNIHEQE